MQFNDNFAIMITSLILSSVGVVLFYFIKQKISGFEEQIKELLSSQKKDTEDIRENFSQVLNLVNAMNNELTRSVASQNVRNENVASQLNVLFEKTEKQLGLIHHIERDLQRVSMLIDNHVNNKGVIK